MGVISSARANTATDTIIQGVALTLIALPPVAPIIFFQLGMIALATQGLPHLPVAGWDITDPSTIVAPVLLTALTGYGGFTRLTRAAMVEEMHKDYIRTARAKGLAERAVLYQHAFRNAALPLVSYTAISIASVVTGLFLTESFFNIPGIANASLNAISQRDWPVLQGTVILIAFSVVIMNMVSDVAYGLLDPRIKTA